MSDWIKDALIGFPALASRKQTADAFGVSISTVQRLIASGELEAIKIGGCVKISRRAAEKCLATRRAP